MIFMFPRNATALNKNSVWLKRQWNLFTKHTRSLFVVERRVNDRWGYVQNFRCNTDSNNTCHYRLFSNSTYTITVLLWLITVCSVTWNNTILISTKYILHMLSILQHVSTHHMYRHTTCIGTSHVSAHHMYRHTTCNGTPHVSAHHMYRHTTCNGTPHVSAHHACHRHSKTFAHILKFSSNTLTHFKHKF
jgi:hypothetical protein